MSELKLQCHADPKTDYLTCRRDTNGMPLMQVWNEDIGGAYITLTKEDALILADKLYSIVKGE